MRIKIKIKLDRVKEVSRKSPRKAAEHAFLTFLILFFLAAILGSLVFYQYSFLAEKSELEIAKESIKFKGNFYQNILDEWQNREERFLGAEIKEYPDPFERLTK